MHKPTSDDIFEQTASLHSKFPYVFIFFQYGEMIHFFQTEDRDAAHVAVWNLGYLESWSSWKQKPLPPIVKMKLNRLVNRTSLSHSKRQKHVVPRTGPKVFIDKKIP